MQFEFLEKIPAFLRAGLADVVKALIGAFIIGFMAYKWVRSERKAARAKVEAEQQKLAAQLAEHKADHHREIAGLTSQFMFEKVDLQQDLMRTRQACQDIEGDHERLANELAALQKRLTDLESFDGRLWEREVALVAPKFVAITQRPTRLISVMNLKGGVGKTTLTANLGVSLARRGLRVLMVDLDFQGSLTRLCLSTADQGDLVGKRLTISRLLEVENTPVPASVVETAQPVRSVLLPNLACSVIAASEDLAEAELKAQARWLVTHRPDARFLLRQAFHQQQVFDCYDFVLFDCPPRLTTACINALACCDFLLVPVLLEQGSVEALPRTLAWMTRLPHVTRARLLGVVANRVEMRSDQLIAAQKNIFTFLPEAIRNAGFAHAHFFTALVRNQRRQIEDAANTGRIAAATEEGLALFNKIAEEVMKGVNQ